MKTSCAPLLPFLALWRSRLHCGSGILNQQFLHMLEDTFA
jgi:hypothetical protein